MGDASRSTQGGRPSAASRVRAAIPIVLALVLVAAVSLRAAPAAAAPASSAACVKCHAGIEEMHPEASIKDPATGKEETRTLTCVECHGGNGSATEKAQAHVQPRNKDMFGVREYRKSSYAAINGETPEFIRFMNPSDLRIADRTCGTSNCHEEIVRNNRKSIMANNAMVHNAVFYNNGAIDRKVPIYGEAFTPNGEPALLSDESWTEELAKRGAIPSVRPHPEPKSTKARDIFRIFEPGNFVAGLRLEGTDAKIAVVYLNVLKTRLNDPSLWFIGTNEQSGDYRHSGCAACHSVYANDRDGFRSPDGKTIYHAGTLPSLFSSPEDFLKNGNKGVSRSGATVLPHNVGGFPVIHKLTTAVPSSQCITCHHHQGNAAVLTYEGSLWWDYETDAAGVRAVGGWAADSYAYAPQLSHEDHLKMMGKQDELSEHNPSFKQVQFADQHGHSWNFRKVYKMDRHGTYLDAANHPIADNDPQKFAKAVHLRDIHLEKGMHCIDCHTEQDMHGDGHIYGQMTDAIEIECIDCHGTAAKRATLKSSGPAGGNSLARARTGFGAKWLEWKDGVLIQHSKIYKDVTWRVPQVADVIDPKNPSYSPAAAHGMGMLKDGTWGQPVTDESTLAHQSSTMTCYACHSSWNTVCSGCHLPFDPNIAAPDKHYLNQKTRGYAPYNAQALRSDMLSLGIGSDTAGSKITPFRSASSVVVTARDRNGNVLVHQQPTLSTNGFSGFAYSPNIPHTVRTTETQPCSSCHPDAQNDNNAWLANLLGTGTNALNFVGEYAYVASGGGGITAVKVTEGEEPQPVIGSRFHEVLHPDSFRSFVGGGRTLRDGIQRPTTEAKSVATQGEFAFVADGKGGVVVYDIAFIDDKSFTPNQRISDNRKAMFDSGVRLATADAAYIALPSSTPLSLDRNRHRDPGDREQDIHPLYGYAAVADRQEGLILINIETFSDRNPENNDIKRTVTFNPDGKLTGAQMVRFVGNYLYLACGANGIKVVDISNPLQPKLVGGVDAPAIDGARAVVAQLRYAFVLDRQGLKVLDITDLTHPVPVPGATVALADARGLTVYRTTALVAAGADGLALVDVEQPTKPKLLDRFTAAGVLNDANDVVVGMTNVSTFAYVADGKNGMRIVRLIEPDDTPGALGYAPRMTPKLIATYPTSAPALAMAEGQVRDRYVDESGNQIYVSGRMGSRPFSRKEMDRFLKTERGEVFHVDDHAELAVARPRPQPVAVPADIRPAAPVRERAAERPRTPAAPRKGSGGGVQLKEEGGVILKDGE